MGNLWTFVYRSDFCFLYSQRDRLCSYLEIGVRTCPEVCCALIILYTSNSSWLLAFQASRNTMIRLFSISTNDILSLLTVFTFRLIITAVRDSSYSDTLHCFCIYVLWPWCYYYWTRVLPVRTYSVLCRSSVGITRRSHILLYFQDLLLGLLSRLCFSNLRDFFFAVRLFYFRLWSIL